MTDQPGRGSKRPALLGVIILALCVLGTGLALSVTSEVAERAPGDTPTSEPATGGTLLSDDAYTLATALGDINTAMDGYPNSLYWFQVQDLGVTFFDAHRLAWYTVEDDNSEYTACLSSIETGEWVLFDSAAGDITGTGTTPDDQPMPDCVADGEKPPSAKTLAGRATAVDAASLGDLVASFHADTQQFPKRSELRKVTDGLVAPGNRLATYSSDETSFRLCVANRRHDVASIFDSTAAGTAKNPAVTTTEKCEP